MVTYQMYKLLREQGLTDRNISDLERCSTMEFQDEVRPEDRLLYSK